MDSNSSFSANSTTENPRSLSIVTYNIHGGIGADGIRDYQRIGEHLTDLGVDIALLQEVDARQDINAPHEDPQALCAHPQQVLVACPAVTTEAGWYGNALLSRYPILESRSVDVSQPGVEPRNIQIATMDLGQLKVCVINTHKGLKKAERLAQFARLHNEVEALTMQADLVILGGDFNEWQFLTRAFRDLNQTLIPVKTSASFPSRWPLFKLDRLWVSKSPCIEPAATLKARVLKNRKTRLHSDHCPILLTLDLQF